MKSINKVLFFIAMLAVIMAATASADNFLRVYATVSGTDDTVGVCEQYLVYGVKTPVFIAPYTIHFTIFPSTDSLYQAKIDCYELGPDYHNYQYENELAMNNWQTIPALESKGVKFDYHYIIFKDTVQAFNYLPTDSLVSYLSIHFSGWIWRYSLAEYKWEMRKAYLENIFNLYRKQHKVTRSGKINLYFYPGSNNTPFINNLTGTGYDFASKAMYAVLNENYDSALPENAELYVIYETWGYGPRFIAVGYSRYFLYDIYPARAIVKNMTAEQLEAILSEEYPANREEADILSGALIHYLFDTYGLPQIQKLYKLSRPGYLAFNEVYQKSSTEIINEFLNYEKELQMKKADATFISSLYGSQLWFDKALEYDFWLANQLIGRDNHLKELGGTYFQLGEYQKSHDTYAILLEHNPDKPEPKYLMGMSLLRLGDTKQAMRYFGQIADSMPNAAKIAAEIYLDQGEYKKAEKMLAKIPEFPDSWTALLKARWELASGDNAKAQAILSKELSLANTVATLSPAEARGYIDVASGLMLLGKYDEAASELQVAMFVDKRPYYQGMAALEMGRLYDSKGDQQTALKYYNQALAANCGEYIKKLAAGYIQKPYKLK